MDLHCKCNAQSEIACSWAQVIAKGYVQIFGKDFKNTFAPTVHSASPRILLSLAASKGNKVIIKQANIKNTYLNALLN